MAGDPPTATSGLTYADLRRFPDDRLRREIIDGELHVTPAPATRHQRAVTRILAAMWSYAERHGGEVFPAPTDVFFGETTVVEPDVLFVAAANLGRIEASFVRGAPDLVVEVSSPSTRRVDQIRKRRLYEREGVAEYWFVDLDADRVEVHRLTGGTYGTPLIAGPGDAISPPHLPGLTVAVDDIVPPGA